MKRTITTLALAAALALGLAGCEAASTETPPRGPVTETLQWERIPTSRPAGPMSPELARHLDASPEGASIGLVIRGEDALLQWERVASAEGIDWLQLVFTQGEQVIVQILPPTSTWAHVAGVVPGVDGSWSLRDSDGVEVVSGTFSELVFETWSDG